MKPHQSLKAPLERRFQLRHEFFDYDRLKLHAQAPSQRPLHFMVEDIHSCGALVFLKENEKKLQLQRGMELIDISIYYNDLLIGSYAKSLICHTRTNTDGHHVGIYFASNHAEIAEHDKRELHRLDIRKGFEPHAVAPHPFRYDDFLHFSVQDISKQGARLSTSARNSLLLAGCPLKTLTFHLPTVGQILLHSKITYVYPDFESNQFIVGIQFDEMPSDSEKQLVKYLINFSENSGSHALQSLKTAGLSPKFVKTHLDYSFASCLEDYQRVLVLRHQAYCRAGKIANTSSPKEMSDLYDLHSKIIVSRHQGEIVGSVRMTFCSRSGDQFELDNSIKLPRNLDRNSTVEISRLCVDARFENTDLVLGLIERCTELTAKMGVRFAITSCVKEMIPYYKKLGFFPTGRVFELKTLNNIPHSLLMHDCRSNRSSFGMNPVYWYFAYKNIGDHMRRLGFLKPNWVAALMGFVARAAVQSIRLWQNASYKLKKIR